MRLFVLLFGFAIVGCSGQPQPPVTAQWGSNVWAAYDSNVASADLKYLNKTVEFGVSPVNVEKDAQGNYYIGSGQVVCFVVPADISKLASLKNDSVVKLRGTCLGVKKDALAPRGIVTFKDCRVTATLKDDKWVENK